MSQIEKNTVEAKNQLKTNVPIFYENKDGKGKRVLFIGNSITLHGFKSEIGWYGVNYGMAASSKEKDYVHLVMDDIKKTDKDAVTCIAQISDWETAYVKGNEVLLEKYTDARDFNADIIILRFVENCSIINFDKDFFYQKYLDFVNFFRINSNSKIIITTSFWKHPADESIIKVGKDLGLTTIYLGDLGEDESMKAIGLFEHNGVANHPGDKGMRYIADRIIKAINAL